MSGYRLLINLSPPDPIECAMCEAVGDFSCAVPYYCGPVLEGQSEGGYRCVCGPCYARWLAWSNRITEERAASARLAWDAWKPSKDIA
jgi:hypothetical protein